MLKRVVINRGDNDVRVAFLEDSNLVEFHIENLLDRTIVGNIYRGVVQDVIPGLQAAFVDVGLDRNVFLHFMDIRPEARVMLEENLEEAMIEAAKSGMPGRIQLPGRRPRPDPKARDTPPPVKKGDTLIIQVVKDEISDKAPRAAANITLAGRYLVLLPFPSQQGGVSRRVALGQERMKLKKLLSDLRTDQYSFIVRTAGLGVEEEQIRSDVELLTSDWNALVARFRSLKGPGLVYSDHDIVNRLVRDAFKADIDEVVVDDTEMAEALRATLAISLPDLVDKVIDYDGREPVFTTYQVDAQLQKALARKVWLKSGGYLIIDETEALTAIDVNSGRFTGSKDQEKTSVRTNMEACETIAQQIRLRDIGGIIVIDFIDMLSREHQQRVADELKHQMRHDRAKYTIGRLGDFGLMMMTRKRKHQSLQKQVFDPCPYCKGEGRILCADEVWRRIRRDIDLLAHEQQKLSTILLCTSPAILTHLRADFAPFLELFTRQAGIEIILQADAGLHNEDYTLTPIRRPDREAPQLPAVRLAADDVIRAAVSYDKRPAAVELKDAPSSARPAQVTASRGPAGRTPVARPALPVATPPPAVAQRPAAPRPTDETPESEEDPRRRTRRGRRGGRRRRGGPEVPGGEVSTPMEGVSAETFDSNENELDPDRTPTAGILDEEIELEDDVVREAVNFILEGEGAAPTHPLGSPKKTEELAARVPDDQRRQKPRPVHPDRRPTPGAETGGAPLAGGTGKVRIVNNWGTAQASPVFKKARRTSLFQVASAPPPEKPHVPTARKIKVLGTWGTSTVAPLVAKTDREEPVLGLGDPAHVEVDAPKVDAAAQDSKSKSSGRRGRRGGSGRSKGQPEATEPKTVPAKAVPAATAPEPAKAAPAPTLARRSGRVTPGGKTVSAPKAPPAKAAPVAPAPAVKAQPSRAQKAKPEPAKPAPAKVQPAKAAPAKAQPVKAAAKKAAVKASPVKSAAKPASKATAPKPAPVKKAAAKVAAPKKAAKKTAR
jgi:ribonuclease G